MNKKLISVITPVYNIISGGRLELFTKNIESVLNQTYENVEHIIVDGGSTDGTVDLLEKYFQKGRIKYISEKDNGVYFAMNKGIKLSKGGYITFLNSDDYYIDNFGLADSIKLIESGNYDFSFAPVKSINNTTNYSEIIYPNIKKIFYSLGAICHQSIIYKSEIFDEFGTYDTKYKTIADYDLNLKMCLGGKKGINVGKLYVSYSTDGMSKKSFEDGSMYDELTKVYISQYSKITNLQEYEIKNLIGRLNDNNIWCVPHNLAECFKSYSEYFDFELYKSKFKKKFSIITINFNDVHGLRKTIESVKKQKYKDFEFIVVDANSTDGSAELIKSETKIIDKFLIEDDKGRYDGMNKGINLAEGSYLIFLNSGDSFINEDVLLNANQYISDQLLVYGDIIALDEKTQDRLHVAFPNHMVDPNFFLSYSLPHQATFFHALLFKRFGLYDESFKIYGDLDFYLKLITNKISPQHIPLIVSEYNMSGISANDKYLLERNIEKSSIFEKYISYPPIHFFTIVLNGKPFIDYHIEVMKKLEFKWHWHIIEGAAELKHDTAWSVANGGKLEESFTRDNLSQDGTSEYLDSLVKEYPENVSVYRKDRKWNGKTEMVNAPLERINEECILWQLDSDEIWTLDQINKTREMYMLSPDKTSANYLCNYFVGEKLVLQNFGKYANNLFNEWIRTWRFQPGDRFLAHEPPTLCRFGADGRYQDINKVNPFSYMETAAAGLIFQHYAYVTEVQIEFKEKYYGYSGLKDNWKKLNSTIAFPVQLKEYFPWVKDKTLVYNAKQMGVEPIYEYTDGKYIPKYDFGIRPKLVNSFQYLSAFEFSKNYSLLSRDFEKEKIKILQIDHLNAELRNIRESISWKLFLKIKKLFKLLFPKNSFQYKFVRVIFKVIRKIVRKIRHYIFLIKQKIRNSN